MFSARVVRRLLVLSTVVAAVLVAPSSRGPGAQPAALAPHQQLLREIYQELIKINTTNSIGDNTKAAEAMARRLIAAGFPAADVQVLVPAPRKGNVVARLRGTGARRPLLLLAHLDVVEANREDWSVDPFKLLELLRSRHGGRQGDGRCVRRQPDPLPPGRLRARSRSDRGVDCRRRRGRA